MTDGLTSLSNSEIQDLLSSTLEGGIPLQTMSRIFATLAEVPILRRQANGPSREELLNQDIETCDRMLRHMKRARSRKNADVTEVENERKARSATAHALIGALIDGGWL